MTHSVSAGKLINIYDILSTQKDSKTNTITCQLGTATTGEVYSDSAEYWQPPGFASLPSPVITPNPKDAPQAISINRVDQEIIFATRDVRTQQNYVNIKPGEVCLFGSGTDGNAQGKVMIKQDSSVTLYTTDSGNNGGNGVFFKVSPTAFQFVAPWGTLIFDATGFHVTTSSGAKFDLGGLAMPAPLNALTSYCNVTAGNTNINSSFVQLGSGPSYTQIATTSASTVSPVMAPAQGSILVGPGGPFSTASGVYVTKS